MKKRLIVLFVLILAPIVSAECCLLNGSTMQDCPEETAYQGRCEDSYVLLYEDLSGAIQKAGKIKEGNLFVIPFGNTTLPFAFQNGAISASLLTEKVVFNAEIKIEKREGGYGLKVENNNLLIPNDKVNKAIKIGKLSYEVNDSFFNKAVSYLEIPSLIHFVNYSGVTYETRETIAIKGMINNSEFLIGPEGMSYLYAFRTPLPINEIAPNKSLIITFSGKQMEIVETLNDGQRLFVNYGSSTSIANNDIYEGKWKWKLGVLSAFNLELANNNSITLKNAECAPYPNGFMNACFTATEREYYQVAYLPNETLWGVQMQSFAFEKAIFLNETAKAKKVFIAKISAIKYPEENKAEEPSVQEAGLQATTEIKAETPGRKTPALNLPVNLKEIKKAGLILAMILGALVFLLLLRERES
ncbi:hypothetical protein HY501_03495 [Candidatus Woesearchaeota archaeon]|nr:hypothetical protein [Candidatus Woesearchaeota archaeon]